MIASTRNALNVARQRRAALMMAAVAGVGAVGFVGSAARAADVHWNVANGSWDVASNWNPAQVPGSVVNQDDRAIIDAASGSAAHVVTTVPDVLAVIVRNSNTLSVDGGGLLNVKDNADAANGVRIGDGGVGAATLAGTGTAQLSTGGGAEGSNVIVGIGGGAGTVTQSNPNSKVASGRDLFVGAGGGSTGVYNQSAGTLSANG